MQVLQAPAQAVSGEIFNLGDARFNYTLAALATEVRAVFPHTRIEHIQNTDLRNYRVSFDKIWNRLGFEGRTSLNEGLEELKSALTSGRVADYTAAQYNNQRFLQNAGSPALERALDTQVMAAFAGTPMTSAFREPATLR